MSRLATFLDKFKKGLEKYGLRYDDVINNYRYCGGDYDHHLNYFLLSYKYYEKPNKKFNCICDHVIKRNCYITNGDNMLVLGNCCIKRFILNSSRTCEVCGEGHKNRKDNKCNNCRRNLCEVCGKEHKNEMVKRCNNCRKGLCDICDKRIKDNYTKCYDCYKRLKIRGI